MKKYSPEADPDDWANVIAYYHAAAVVHLLTACGNDLTRENLMYQATLLSFFVRIWLTRLGLQGDSGSPTGALHPVRLSVSPATLYRYFPPVAHAIAARSLLALGSKKQRCFGKAVWLVNRYP